MRKEKPWAVSNVISLLATALSLIHLTGCNARHAGPESIASYKSTIGTIWEIFPNYLRIIYSDGTISGPIGENEPCSIGVVLCSQAAKFIAVDLVAFAEGREFEHGEFSYRTFCTSWEDDGNCLKATFLFEGPFIRGYFHYENSYGVVSFGFEEVDASGFSVSNSFVRFQFVDGSPLLSTK